MHVRVVQVALFAAVGAVLLGLERLLKRRDRRNIAVVRTNEILGARNLSIGTPRRTSAS
jgi:hypothetical protein